MLEKRRVVRDGGLRSKLERVGELARLRVWWINEVRK